MKERSRATPSSIRATFPLFLLPFVALVSCARGSSGDGPSSNTGDPIDPPAGAQETPLLAGLISAAGGPGSARVDWILPNPCLEAALFRSTQANDVYTGPPVAEPLVGDELVVNGLPDGVEQFFGLGVRPMGGTSYTPTGVVLSVRPGAPIYVDAVANPVGADGQTPATAFPDLRAALLTALGVGGGNVWVRDGTYDIAASSPVFAGVNVYGGFGAAFDLTDRDPGGGGTVVSGPPSQPTFLVQGGAPAAVFDGLVMEGNDTTSIAIDVVETSVEIRSVDVRDFTDRGIRVRNTTDDCFDVVVADSSSSSNGADGLSCDGALDVRIDGSRFDSNAQEGLDLDDLVALEDETAVLSVSGCRFFGNGAEGLDVDLIPPPVLGPLGGRFSVSIRGSRFELNGLDGLLIDEDFELTPGWTADIEVIGCLARANRENGIRIDADAPANVLLHRVLASGNAADGVWISSESDAGIVVVSASVVAGNLRAGMRASLGNRAAIASHCIFAGNFAAGFVSETVESSAASSVAYLQPNPWQGVRLDSFVEIDDPFAGGFENAAEDFARVNNQVQENLTLAGSAGFAPGAAVELADDEVALTAVQVNGSSVQLDVAPALFLTPGLLSAFAPGASVTEDYRLPPGSPAEGAGMTPPGGPIVDAGVWGSPAAGEPGVDEEVRPPLFRPTETSPPPSTRVGSQQTIEVVFSGTLDAASVIGDEVRAVTSSGAPLAIGFMPLGDRIAIMPPAGGWGAETFVIQIHAGLRAQDGTPLSTPVALPFRPQ